MVLPYFGMVDAHKRSMGTVWGMLLFSALCLFQLLLWEATNTRPDMRCEMFVDSARNVCYRKAFEAFTEHRGPEYALHTLRGLVARGILKREYCHALTHSIGETAYRKYGAVDEALARGDLLCFAGYFHGVFSAALKGTGGIGVQMYNACDRYSFSSERFRRYQCVHGLGHGFTVGRDYDVFAALADCDALSGEWDRVYCGGGALMENVWPQHYRGGGNPPFLRADAPLYPCDVIVGRHVFACYQNVPRGILKNGGGVVDAFRACESVPALLLRTFCYRCVGNIVAEDVAAYSVPTSLQFCMKGSVEARGACIGTVAKAFAMNEASVVAGVPVCQRSPAEFRGECFMRLGQLVPSLHGGEENQWVSYCGELADAAYLPDCLQGVSQTQQERF